MKLVLIEYKNRKIYSKIELTSYKIVQINYRLPAIKEYRSMKIIYVIDLVIQVLLSLKDQITQQC